MEMVVLVIIKNNMVANIKNYRNEELKLEDIQLDAMVRVKHNYNRFSKYYKFKSLSAQWC